MSSETIVFNDYEFEMSLITYKRALFVKEWLEECYDDLSLSNVVLSIYDSSDDDETETMLKSSEKYKNIKYIRLPDTTSGGYKYIPPILETQSKYIMIVGDSRCHCVRDLNERVFPLIKQGYDVISLSYFNDEPFESKEYNDANLFFEERFIPITCCGMTIFKTEVFESIRHNEIKRKDYNQKYQEMFGFAYLGYYLEAYAEKDRLSVAVKIPWHKLKAQKKVQYWNKKYYECWCDELCQIMDHLPNVYLQKDEILQRTWNRLHLATYDIIAQAKNAGGLTYNDYKRMVSKGYLKRVTKRIGRFRFSSIMPIWLFNFWFFFFRAIRKTLRLIGIKKA